MLLRNVPATKKCSKSRFVAALIVCVCFAACSKPVTELDLSDQAEWREGDLVFRCGWGAESRMVTTRSQSSYSHVGLLHYDADKAEWQVIHAVPGEDEPEYVKAEPVSVFFSRERARSGAWARIDCPDSIASKATQYALGKVAAGVTFDNDYLLQDSTRLYCTELVWRAYSAQNIDVSFNNRHSVPSIFSKEGEGIFPIDIEQSTTTLFIHPLKTKSL